MTDSAALPSAPLPLTLRTEIALADRAPGDRPALESQVCPLSGRVTTVCPPELLTMPGSEQIWRFQARALQALLARGLGPATEAAAGSPLTVAEAIAPPPPPEPAPPDLPLPDLPLAEVVSPTAADLPVIPEPEILMVAPPPEAASVCDANLCPVPEPAAELTATPVPDWFAALEPPLEPEPVLMPPEPDAPAESETVAATVPEPEADGPVVPGVDPQAATVVVGGLEPVGAPWQMAARAVAAPPVPVEAPLPWADAPLPAAGPESALPAWMTEPVTADTPAVSPLPWGDSELPAASEAAFTPPAWMEAEAPAMQSEPSLTSDLFAELELQDPVELPDLEPDPLADLELPPLPPKG
jgi:hypothetical protein